MNKKLTFFLMLIVGILGCIKAQEAPQKVNILTPNAANLGVFGNTPVSFYTGTPQIDIPLYSLRTNGIEIPISLSYNSGGVRPDQRSGWVGTNWNLNAGGVISRIVKGIPDETIDAMITGKNELGLYYKYDFIYKDNNWATNDNIVRVLNDALIDREPDEFTFSLPGCSGSFYLNGNKQWAVKSDRPVKVEFSGEFISAPFEIPLDNGYVPGNIVRQYYKPFIGFTIITDDGVKYIFGGNNNAIEYSIPFYNQYQDSWIANSWYLTKVIHPNGAEVNFDYERGDFICQMYYNINYVTKLTGSNNQSCSGTSEDYVIKRYYDGKLLSPVYLKEIKSGNQQISFSSSESSELKYLNEIFTFRYNYPYQQQIQYAPFPFLSDFIGDFLGSIKNLKWRKLNRIIISENSQTQIIGLKYNNSGDGPLIEDIESNDRLFLEKVAFYNSVNDDLQGKKSKEYKFFYYKKDLLPGYLSNKLDSWDGYNGVEASLQGDYTGTRSIIDADKSKAGILTTIIYPTGGSTKFEYENNDYGKRVLPERWKDCISENKKAGGLRIKKITDYTDSLSTVANSREYFYTDIYPVTSSSKSSGILSSTIQYQINDYTVKIWKEDRAIKRSTFSSQSVLPSSIGGSDNIVGYSCVTEKNRDGSFTRYYFTNFDNGHLDEQSIYTSNQATSIYQPYNSKSLERGKLQSIKKYRSDNKLISEKTIGYAAVSLNSDNFVKTIRAYAMRTCLNSYAETYYEGTAYKIYIYPYLPVSEIEKKYDPNTSALLTSTEKEIAYDTSKLLRTEKNTLKKGANTESYIKEYRYPTDLSVSPYTEMKSKNMINFPVEVITRLNGNVVGGVLTTYDGKFPKELYTLKIHSPLSSFSYYNGTTKDSNYGNADFTYIYNDAQVRNLAHVTGKDGTSISYIWGYKGLYPIAAINNLSYADLQKNMIIHPDEISNLDVPNFKVIDDLRFKIKTAQITTFKYKALSGIVSVKNQRGIIQYYDYDASGRLKVIYNNDKKKLTEFEYKYKDYPLSSNNSSGNETPLTLTLSSIAERYAKNETPTVSVSHQGGSGQYSYNWIIKNVFGFTDFNKIGGKSIQLTFSSMGNSTLYCFVTDLETQETYEVSKNIYIGSSPIKFSNIVSNYTTGIATASIYCDEPTKVTFRISVLAVPKIPLGRLNLNVTGSGIFTIAGQIYPLMVDGTGSSNVTVQLRSGNNLMKIEASEPTVENLDKVAATLTIDNIDSNNAQIGSPSSITTARLRPEF